MAQDGIFFESEGNAWFRRNRTTIEAIGEGRSNDYPSHAVSLLNSQSPLGSILELGCSKGSRLAFLQKALEKGKRYVGVDAGREAIEEGRRDYPGLELHHGLLSEVPLKGEFDCVIVNFVLHWVDRTLLARAIAEIDRLVKDGGYLVLGDFSPDYPQRRRYHHLEDAEVYTFKQDYPAIFKSLGTYGSVQRQTFNHDIPAHPAVPTTSSNRAFCEVLAKSSQGYYPEIKA